MAPRFAAYVGALALSYFLYVGLQGGRKSKPALLTTTFMDLPDELISAVARELGSRDLLLFRWLCRRTTADIMAPPRDIWANVASRPVFIPRVLLFRGYLIHHVLVDGKAYIMFCVRRLHSPFRCTCVWDAYD
jgi:hypothetical protein